jgi:hypothetical protein
VVGNRPSGPAILGCRTSGDGVPSVPSPLNDAASEATGRAPERRAQLLVRQRERVRDCRSHLLLVPGVLRGLRDLGLQLCRSIDHVETRSPPYVDGHCSRAPSGSNPGESGWRSLSPAPHADADLHEREP